MDVDWLNAVLRYHPGLQYVESLETFPWPATEAAESDGGGEGELELWEQSRLKELGYDTTKSRSVRWRVLTTKAIPELGLPKIASMIAWFCRLKKRQRGGSQRFARAIGEWEHDLERLKREIYPNHRPRFVWQEASRYSRRIPRPFGSRTSSPSGRRACAAGCPRGHRSAQFSLVSLPS